MKFASRSVAGSLIFTLVLLGLAVFGLRAASAKRRALAQTPSIQVAGQVAGQVADALARRGASAEVQERYAAAVRRHCGMTRYASAPDQWLGDEQQSSWQSLAFEAARKADDPCQAEVVPKLDFNDEQVRFTTGVAVHENKQGLRWMGATAAHGLWRGDERDTQRMQPISGSGLVVDSSDGQVVYVINRDGTVQRSRDGGASFAAAHEGIVNDGLNDNGRGAPLSLDVNDAQRLWTGGRALWRSRDGATLWEPASASLPGSEANRVSAIAVQAFDSNHVLVGTSEGDILRSHSALSANAETVWQSVKPRDGFISSIVTHPYYPNVAYVTYTTYLSSYQAHLWRTQDGGASWQPLGESDLPEVAAHALALDPANALRMWLGTDVGVFVSLDGGEHWAVEATGFGAAVTEALSIAQNGLDISLLAFTHGRGVWRVRLAESSQQCSYSLAPGGLFFDASGGNGTINVATSVNCTWTVSGVPNWMTITSGAGGLGSGTVMLTVAPNTALQARVVSLAIAGRTFTVEQNGQNGNCVTLPIQPEQAISGALAEGDCRRDNFSLAWADKYSYRGRAGELVAVTMNAPGFFSRIQLIGAGSAVLQDSGFSNIQVGIARLPNFGVYQLPENGEYIIQATSIQSNVTGEYGLTLHSFPAGCDSFTFLPGNRAFDATGGQGSL